MCRGPPVRVAEEGLLVVVPSTEAGGGRGARDPRPPGPIPQGRRHAAAGVRTGGGHAPDPAAPEGAVPHLVAAPVALPHQPGQLTRGAPGAHRAKAVPVAPRPNAAAPVAPAIPIVLIDDPRRLHPPALLLQPP